MMRESQPQPCVARKLNKSQQTSKVKCKHRKVRIRTYVCEYNEIKLNKSHSMSHFSCLPR